MKSIPEYLSQGDTARLFPVLATTSKEGRATSVFLACMSCVQPLGQRMLATVGQRAGVRARLKAYTEVVFKGMSSGLKERPDGLLVLDVGKRTWRALVEAKVGTAELDADQLERYRTIAKEAGLDAVITISNQFTAAPHVHPIRLSKKGGGKIALYHWSWMRILTEVDLLLASEDVEDDDHVTVLRELQRFLAHDSTGVRGFTRMPPEWSDMVRHVAAGGAVAPNGPEADAVVRAWHQELRDLSLIMSRQTRVQVEERLPRAEAADPALREKSARTRLKDGALLTGTLSIPDAAAPLDICVDLRGRTIRVGMSLKAPADKVRNSARLNWLLRQVSQVAATDDLHVAANWPSRVESTQCNLERARSDPGRLFAERDHLTTTGFEIFCIRRLGGRFGQASNFIADLEQIVPGFYSDVGQYLAAWQPPAPKVVKATTSIDDAIAEPVKPLP